MEWFFLLISGILLSVFFFIGFSKLQNGTYSLGLPQGSVRALLAIFVISVFIATTVKVTDAAMNSQTSRTLSNVSQNALNKLYDNPRIIVLSESFPKPTEDNEKIYPTVEVLIDSPSTIANHFEILIGALVALVSSLSGYYFGNKKDEISRLQVPPSTLNDEALMVQEEINDLQQEISESSLSPEQKQKLLNQLEQARTALDAHDIHRASEIVEIVESQRLLISPSQRETNNA